MSDYTHKLGRKLNDLLEKNYDAEKGFLKAAENAKHGGLNSNFTDKAKERTGLGDELKSELRNFGQEADDGGSLLGAVHHSWKELRMTMKLCWRKL